MPRVPRDAKEKSAMITEVLYPLQYLVEDANLGEYNILIDTTIKKIKARVPGIITIVETQMEKNPFGATQPIPEKDGSTVTLAGPTLTQDVRTNHA